MPFGCRPSGAPSAASEQRADDNNEDSTASVLPILSVQNGRVIANSRDVAEAFGKRHDNVLRDIDDLISHTSDLRDGFFLEVQDAHPTVARRMIRSFDMDRDGFALLAMGFTGTKAMKFKLAYIAAFNRMEAELKRHASAAPRATISGGVSASEVAAMLDAMERRIIDALAHGQQRAAEAVAEVVEEAVGDTGRMLTAGEASGLPYVPSMDNSEIGYTLTEFCRSNGYPLGSVRKPWGKVNTYPLAAIKALWKPAA